MVSNRKVDLMIVGAQKSGTTSLKNYLGQHHDVVTHPQTEFTYFLPNSPDGDDLDFVFNYYFPQVSTEASPKVVAKSAAMYVVEESLVRLKTSNPECLIVLLVRNPVDRAYSSYLMEVNSGLFDRPWSAIIGSLKKAGKGEKDQMFRLFIEMGMYAEQLKKIYRHFPKENVLIFSFDDLKSDPGNICKILFKRMGVDAKFSPDTVKHYNPAKRPRIRPVSKFVTQFRINNNPFKRMVKRILPPSTYIGIADWVLSSLSRPHRPQSMAPEIKSQLLEFFRPYNDELKSMTGLKIDNWGD